MQQKKQPRTIGQWRDWLDSLYGLALTDKDGNVHRLVSANAFTAYFDTGLVLDFKDLKSHLSGPNVSTMHEALEMAGF